MSDAQSNIESVQRAFGAAMSSDWDTVRRMAHEDFTWHIPGQSRVAGDAVGVEEFAAKLQTLFASGLNVELLNVMGAGDQVITVQRNSASVDGAELDIHVLNLYTFVGGKLARMQTFPSDQYALDAFWGS